MTDRLEWTTSTTFEFTQLVNTVTHTAQKIVIIIYNDNIIVISPPGYAGQLMFCWCYFLFLMSTLLFDNGWTHPTRIVDLLRLTPSTKKILRLRIWWTSFKGHCHGNQFCGARWRQVGIPRLCLCWHFKRMETLATPIVALTSTIIPPRLIKILWTLVVQYPLRSCCSRVGGCTHCQNTHVCDVSTIMPGLIFAKLSENIAG